MSIETNTPEPHPTWTETVTNAIVRICCSDYTHDTIRYLALVLAVLAIALGITQCTSDDHRRDGEYRQALLNAGLVEMHNPATGRTCPMPISAIPLEVTTITTVNKTQGAK